MKRKPNATPNTTTFTASEPMGVCKFCDLEIAKGRRVMSSFDGTGEFVHVRCWDKEWDRYMQQHREQFERDLLS